MSQQEIFQMIVNEPLAMGMQFNLDTIYDFVIDRVDESDINQFEDINSALKWLHSDDSSWHGQFHANVNENEIPNQASLPKRLKKGIKVTIRKPSASDIKFNDFESVQAYLSQATNYQSNDESDEIDVTTFDYATPWNQYPIVESKQKNRKNSKINRILTENQQAASFTCITNKMPSKKAASKDLDACHECLACGKKYKQKSSLNRHEKIHNPKIVDGEVTVTVKKPPKSTKRVSNGNHQTAPIIPLNTAETIST